NRRRFAAQNQPRRGDATLHLPPPRTGERLRRHPPALDLHDVAHQIPRILARPLGRQRLARHVAAVTGTRDYSLRFHLGLLYAAVRLSQEPALARATSISSGSVTRMFWCRATSLPALSRFRTVRRR